MSPPRARGETLAAVLGAAGMVGFALTCVAAGTAWLDVTRFFVGIGVSLAAYAVALVVGATAQR